MRTLVNILAKDKLRVKGGKVCQKDSIGKWVKCGFWNVNSFSLDRNSDNYKYRADCINFTDCHILDVSETFFRGKNKLKVKNYEWFGQNRKWVKKTAKRRSGGIGFLVHERVLDKCTVYVLDNECEGILWLKFASKNIQIVFTACICYLTPDNSARSTNASDFYNTLLSQMYVYQNIGPMFICGDLNSRHGDNTDYIESVDSIIDRYVVDFYVNSYGESLIDFLISSNFLYPEW